MSRRFTIPAGFPEIFKGFSREALRSLPTDIADADVELWLYEFGASYFGPGMSQPCRWSLPASRPQWLAPHRASFVCVCVCVSTYA